MQGLSAGFQVSAVVPELLVLPAALLLALLGPQLLRLLPAGFQVSVLGIEQVSTALGPELLKGLPAGFPVSVLRPQLQPLLLAGFQAFATWWLAGV